MSAPATTSVAADFAEFFAAGWAIGASDRERFYAHFRERFHPEARLLQPMLPPTTGPDPLPEAFASVFDLVPDLTGEVVRWGQTSDGVMIELTLRGTFKGRHVEWTVVDRIVLDDGLLRERQSYFDPHTTDRTAGGIPMTETINIELSQGTVPVHIDGDGPPVLFVHGALVDHRLWDPVVDLLDGVRAIRPDLPLGSHTNACKPDADLTPPGLARMIAGVMEELDLHDVTIVANDTGGALTQITAANHPERIGRVVLTNCDAYEEFLPKAFKSLQILPYIPGALSATGTLLKVDALRRSPLGYGLLTEKPIPGELLDAWLAPMGVYKGVRRDTAKLLKGINKRHTLAAMEKLRSFDKPVLIVWGKNDKAFKPRLAERLAADIPGARLEWVADSKTFVSLDQPERLAELIDAFVRERPAEPATRA